MIRSLLVRGMLVGLAAGVLAFVFAYIFGEPQVQHAIDFEKQLARLHHEPAETELVSRGVQRTIGLLTGTVVTGVALGGLFGLTFAWAYGRIGAMSPRLTSAVLALGAYLTIIVVPFTKYPANPPTIGNPDTIGRRTLLFVAMITISLVAVIAALLAVGGFVALIVVAQLILPAVHETPKGFPADVLWRFRLASLGINATLWLTIGLGFGALAERLVGARAPRRSAVAVGA
jgi:hypothetical protein